jgi:hypothetical protein
VILGDVHKIMTSGFGAGQKFHLQMGCFLCAIRMLTLDGHMIVEAAHRHTEPQRHETTDPARLELGE